MLRFLAACLALCFAGTGSGLACEGKTTIFEDSFTDETGGWEAGTFYSIDKGELNIKFPSDRGAWVVLNGTFAVKNADICVDFEYPKSGLDLVPGLGISFWAQGTEKGWYIAVLYNDGTLVVMRNVSGQWGTIVSQTVSGVNKGPSGKNRVRVTLKDDRVLVFVNGAKVKEFRAQSPLQDAKFGVIALRKKNGVDQILTVRHYKVTSVD